MVVHVRIRLSRASCGSLPSIGFTQRRPDSVDLQVIQRPRETRIQSAPPLGRLCASPLGCRWRTVVTVCIVRGLTVCPRSHVPLLVSRAHVPASSAARALTNTHKQTTCDERALLCSHRPFLRIRTFLSGVFPVFEAGTDLSISLREMNKSVCPRLEN